MPLATIAQADREYADNVGAQRPESAWILSDRDVWYPNPYYAGPPVPHPEEDCDVDPPEPAALWDQQADEADAQLAHIKADERREARASVADPLDPFADDDIPF